MLKDRKKEVQAYYNEVKKREKEQLKQQKEKLTSLPF
jgi:hypothetical protein